MKVLRKLKFKKGDKIIKDEPFCSSLEINTDFRYCDCCFSRLPEISGCDPFSSYYCTGCFYFRYCSKTCRNLDRAKYHENECGYYQKIRKAKEPFTFVGIKMGRFLFRLYVKMYHHRESVTQEHKSYNNRIRTYDNLMDHFDQYLQYVDDNPHDRRVIELKTMSREFDLLGVPCNKRMMLQLYGRTMTNCFRIDRGIILCLRLSVFNHSCEPNAKVSFKLDEKSRKYKCCAKAICDIEGDEEIFLSYINVKAPVSVRQQLLSVNYFFQCNCIKCTRQLNPNQKTDLNNNNNCSIQGNELITIRTKPKYEFEQNDLPENFYMHLKTY